MTYSKKPIEVALPLDAISREDGTREINTTWKPIHVSPLGLFSSRSSAYSCDKRYVVQHLQDFN